MSLGKNDSDNETTTASDSELVGEWMVEYIYERPVIDNSPAWINLGEKWGLSGNASCNNFFGTYKQDGSSLVLNATGKTNKMCIVEALMEQEARLMAALPNVAGHEIREGIPFLSDENEDIVFRAAQHN